jgi:hypothetical protein
MRTSGFANRFIGGRTRFLGWNIPQPAPPDISASQFDGVILFGTDGALHWSDGTRWRTTDEAVRFLGVGEDLTVEVLASGAPNNRTTFASVSDAAAYLAQFRPNVQGDGDADFLPFRTGTILIKAGHTVKNQISLDGISLGWVRILSEDAVVPVDRAALTRSMKFFATAAEFPLFVGVGGAHMPRIKTMFEATGTGPAGGDLIGLYLQSSAYRDDLGTEDGAPALHGFRGFAVGLVAHSGADVYLTRKSIEACTNRGITAVQQSRVQMFGCRVLGATNHAVFARNGAHVYLQASGVSGYDVYRKDPAGIVDATDDIRADTGARLTFTGGILGGLDRAAEGSIRNDSVVVGRGTFPIIGGMLVPRSYTASTVPSAATYPAHLIHVSNGDAGAPCLAVSNGTDWLRVPLGAAISASA